MTDRELLVRAAKAAGYEVRWHEPWECFVHVGPFNTDNLPTLAGQRMMWVPLHDDGDALRLAVKLRLRLQVSTYGADARHLGGLWQECEASECGGIEAATRRAIVRAAAAMATAPSPA